MKIVLDQKGLNREDPGWSNMCFYGDWLCPHNCTAFFSPCENEPLPCCRGLTCKKIPGHTSMKRCQPCNVSGNGCSEDSDCCTNIHTDNVCVNGSCLSLLGKLCDNDAECRSNPYRMGKQLTCKKNTCNY